MPRILHILWSARFGGIERLVLDLSCAQRYTGSEVDVLFAKRREGEFLESFETSGLRCHFAGLRNGFDFPINRLQKIIRLLRNYDILHFHSFNPFLGLCAVNSGKKIVFTEHGNFGFGRKRRTRDNIKDLVLGRFLNFYVDYISFNSEFTRQFAVERHKLNGVDRSVVYNGINRKKELPSFLGVDRTIRQKVLRKFVVGTSSRFVGFKRIDRLITAFAKFQTNKEAVLLLVGDGPLRSEFEVLVNELNISEQTIFSGFRSNVAQYQNLMDVCVFPSENEPFGIAAVEALALGKPTIVFSDGGGCVEVVGGCSQRNVINDIDGLVDVLEYYFRNKSDLQMTGQHLKEYAEEFDIVRMKRSFDTIYSRLLSCAA